MLSYAILLKGLLGLADQGTTAIRSPGLASPASSGAVIVIGRWRRNGIPIMARYGKNCLWGLRTIFVYIYICMYLCTIIINYIHYIHVCSCLHAWTILNYSTLGSAALQSHPTDDHTDHLKSPFQTLRLIDCIARTETDPEPKDKRHFACQAFSWSKSRKKRGSKRLKFLTWHAMLRQDLQVTQHRGLVLQTSCRKDWRVTILMKPLCLD